MNTLPISSAPTVMRAALLPACRVTVLGPAASAPGFQYAAQAAGENQTSSISEATTALMFTPSRATLARKGVM